MTNRTRVVCEACGWSQKYEGGTQWATHSERLQRAKSGHRAHCPTARYKLVPLPVEVSVV